MRTELPVERLHRRLGAAAEPSSETEPDSIDEDGDDPKTLLPRWLPEADPGRDGTLRGWLATIRADPGRSGGIALAAVAAIAVLVTVFTLIRDEPAPVVSAKLPPVQMAASASTRPGPSPGPSVAPDQPVVVSVVGLVKAPGLVTVTPGARVADAIAAAGGTLGAADTLGLNIARHVADGEQVVVGIAPLPGAPGALGSSITEAGPTTAAGSGSGTGAGKGEGSGSADPKAPLNLNTATVEQLDELPGIGPVTAEAIVSWRDQHGSFSGVDQLGEVDGIGPARLQKLRDLVRV